MATGSRCGHSYIIDGYIYKIQLSQSPCPINDYTDAPLRSRDNISSEVEGAYTEPSQTSHPLYIRQDALVMAPACSVRDNQESDYVTGLELPLSCLV